MINFEQARPDGPVMFSGWPMELGAAKLFFTGDAALDSARYRMFAGRRAAEADRGIVRTFFFKWQIEEELSV